LAAESVSATSSEAIASIVNASIQCGGKKGLFGLLDQDTKINCKKGCPPASNYFEGRLEEAGTGRGIPVECRFVENQRETPMTFRALGFAGIAVAMTAIPAIAHHSFAMFDAEKTKTLEGTVKEFQWTNPHSWILMTVNDDKGQAQQWAIEMGGPAGLARQGWVPKTLTPGMKVKTVIHPLRDGNNGGQFMAIYLPDGTLMGNLNAAPGANAGAAPANQ
jgi:hypothetical protein